MHPARLALTVGVALVAALALAACTTDAPQDSPSPSEKPSPSATTDPVVSLTGTVVAERVGVPRQLVALDERRTLIVDQRGLVHVLADGRLSKTPFLDLRDQVLTPGSDRPETGLAGLALAPDFRRTGLLYTAHSRPPTAQDGKDVQRVDVLTEWRATADRTRVDPGSARELLSVPLDFTEHVGGLAIDDQGLLYAGFGSASLDDAAQDTRSWAGKIIRIDPRKGEPYAVPADNPFADGAGGLPEIWSFGYRNPFRMAWEQSLGLVVAQPMWQEKDQQVSVVRNGDNVGYPAIAQSEESSCYADGGVAQHCRDFKAPDLEYSSDIGRIVSGAQPYRGSVAALAGRVVVSDWSGALLAAEPGPAPWAFTPIDVELPSESVNLYLWALGTDGRGELYALMADKSFGSDGMVVALAD